MTSCSICLDSITSPCCCIPCGHVFCRKCITRWEDHVQSQDYNIDSVVRCPQCRRIIQYLQPVILQGSDSCADVIHSPWDQSEWNPLIQQVSNRWKRSAVKRSFDYVSESVISNENGQLVWNTILHLKQSVVKGVQDVRRVEGGTTGRAKWLWEKNRAGLRKFKTYLDQQPAVDKVKRGWESLNGDLKVLVIVLAVVFFTIIVTDIWNPLGVFQSMVLPVIQTLICAFTEVMHCLLYLVYRPVCCLLSCLLEMAVAFWDMLVSVAATITKIAFLVLYLPLLFVSNLVTWAILFLNFILETLLTLFRFICTTLPFVLLFYVYMQREQRNNV